MLQQFKEDFWAVSREQRGYYSWAQRERWAPTRRDLVCARIPLDKMATLLTVPQRFMFGFNNSGAVSVSSKVCGIGLIQ
jgi:hypothetical protein